MRRWWRRAKERRLLRASVYLGWVLLLGGAFTGWIAPYLPDNPALAVPLRTVIPGSLDVGSFLGAYITAVGLLFAIVTGTNASTLQDAAQSRSLSLARMLFLALLPFLLVCSATIAVALIYFLLPPSAMGQLWQMVMWFLAVICFVIDYLWIAPHRLSAQFLAPRTLQRLRRLPIADLQDVNDYSTLQSLVADASKRGDSGAVRTLADELGNFLARVRDPQAETKNSYDRGRYRALKNLLTGCSQHIAEAPNSIAYYLGHVAAGVLLQAVAVGLPLNDDEHDLFTGLFRNVHSAPERVNALWTGLRHALCRVRGEAQPYLLIFWLEREHTRWPPDDERRTARIAVGLAHFFALSRRALGGDEAAKTADVEAKEMVLDLYRDIATHLAPAVSHVRQQSGGVPLATLVLRLLDATHAQIAVVWGSNRQASPAWEEIEGTYRSRRAEILK